MKTILKTAATALAAVTFAPTPARAQTMQPAWAVVPEGTDAASLPLPAGLTPETVFTGYGWFAGGTTGPNRGVAANPANGHVIVGNRSGALHVLDSDGRFRHPLDASAIATTSVDVPLSHVRAGDDGVIYACNVVTAGRPQNFKIYRWDHDGSDGADPPAGAAVGTVAWPPEGLETSGNPTPDTARRWGDAFDAKGAGANTLLVAGGRSAAPLQIALFDTFDGLTFNTHAIGITGPPDILGVAFGPDVTGYDDPATPQAESLTLVTVFVKTNASPLHRYAVRTDTWSLVSTTAYTGTAPAPDAIAAGIRPIAISRDGRYLGGAVAGPAADGGSPGSSQVYAINTAGGSPSLVESQPFFTQTANGNLVGAADFFVASGAQIPGQGGIPAFPRFYSLNTNNALVAYDIKPALVPPSIAAGPPSGQPADVTVLDGWKASFFVTASGSPPLAYQWLRDGVELPQANGSSHVLDPVSMADTGAVFTVRVTNPAGAVTSNPAPLTVLPRVDTAVLTPAWTIPAGQRAYVDQNNTQRGLAHNPAQDHLLLVNRSAGPGLPAPPNIIVLDAATGAEIPDGDGPRVLRLTDEFDNPVVAGGTFPLNMVDCDAAGAVYAANLVDAATAAASGFSIYRWQNDAPGTPPTVAYGPGDVFASDRCGDQFKVRGAGSATQILVGARNQEKFAVFTTADGLLFAPTVFKIPGAGPASFFQCDFGAGNTVWAKAGGGRLLRVSFDLPTGTAGIEQVLTPAQFPAGVGPIGVDPARQLLGAVHVGENPNNLRLYEYSLIGQPGGLLDLEFFPTDAVNGNGTGCVDFGANRIYALDTNNGIVAMTISYAPAVPAPAVLTDVAYAPAAGGGVLRFTLSGETGASYRIEASPSLAPAAWTPVETITLVDALSRIELSLPDSQVTHFYRAVTLP